MSEERDFDVVMVTTLPRLIFREMASSSFDTIAYAKSRGVPVEYTDSPFWDQSLCGAIKRALRHGRKYLWFVDGDSVFRPDQVMTLYNVVARGKYNGRDVDAAFPTQADRHGDVPLAYNWMSYGIAGLKYAYESPIMPYVHGHFGCTFIRASCFTEKVNGVLRFSEPWAIGKPGVDGSWDGPGKLDPDTVFWMKFHDAGFHAVNVNNVVVGHLQVGIRWQRGTGVLWQTVHDYYQNGPPPMLSTPRPEDYEREGRCPTNCPPAGYEGIAPLAAEREQLIDKMRMPGQFTDHDHRRLEEINDTINRFWTGDTPEPVVCVPENTWDEAQAAQWEGWSKLYTVRDDRSDEHAREFANYEALPQQLGDVLEVGCGPFTQSRTILKGRDYTSLTLTDPLIDKYRTLSHVAYPPEAVCLKQRAEDFTFDEEFDTIILINVLEHVQDAGAVMDGVWRALRPGGLLIIGERETTKPRAPGRDAILHPIILARMFLDGHYDRYEPLYRSGYYMIGRKPRVEEVIGENGCDAEVERAATD